MAWILGVATVLLLGSMAVACYRAGRDVAPSTAADRLFAEAGVRRVVGVGREVMLAEVATSRVLSRGGPAPTTAASSFRSASRPGACAR